MRIAIIHEWLVSYAGSERVLEQMLAVYPDADLFCVIDFLDDAKRDFILGKKPKTTFIQRMPKAQSKYRSYLPLMPLAIEQFDLSEYDLVISSSHAVAKGVLTGPDQLHISCIYSPIRYAWDLQHQYLKEAGLNRGIKGWLAKGILHYIRLWDSRTANSVDSFIAISHFIARRIKKVYRRDSTVIYPPVDIQAFTQVDNKEAFYLAASRLVPYKRIDLIVETFNKMPDRHLVVIGDGPGLSKLKAMAGKNIEILGYQEFEVLKDYMQRARAFIYAAEEDFGIIPLEAQACGTPVIAYGKGALLETIRDLANHEEPTGVFFKSQTVESLRDAVGHFEQNIGEITPDACRRSAERFAPEIFRKNFKRLVEDEFSRFHKAMQI